MTLGLRKRLRFSFSWTWNKISGTAKWHLFYFFHFYMTQTIANVQYFLDKNALGSFDPVCLRGRRLLMKYNFLSFSGWFINTDLWTPEAVCQGVAGGRFFPSSRPWISEDDYHYPKLQYYGIVVLCQYFSLEHLLKYQNSILYLVCRYSAVQEILFICYRSLRPRPQINAGPRSNARAPIKRPRC